jgi:SAM-dependent methyltransferase
MPAPPEPLDDQATARAGNFRTGFDGRRMREYKGLPIYAAPGLHEAAAAMLGAAAVPSGARVLEFGAGSGAMSLRLSDLGFDITASDLFAESFKPVHVPFVAADLNSAFAAQWPRGFDAVMALEIIEHLENPRQVLRQIRALLPVGGQLVLSTPNIANPVSQALFLRSGQFQWFRDVDYREQGHITPLSPWVLEQALREAGFAIRAERAVSSPFRRVRRLGWGVRLLAPWCALLSGLPRARRGELWLVRAEAI